VLVLDIWAITSEFVDIRLSEDMVIFHTIFGSRLLLISNPIGSVAS
jgi:hypothetical protein